MEARALLEYVCADQAVHRPAQNLQRPLAQKLFTVCFSDLFLLATLSSPMYGQSASSAQAYYGSVAGPGRSESAPAKSGELLVERSVLGQWPDLIHVLNGLRICPYIGGKMEQSEVVEDWQALVRVTEDN